MIISHKYKFAFVKTRKTAGSTLEHLVQPFLGPDDICTGSIKDNTPHMNIEQGKYWGHIGHDKIVEHFSVPDDYQFFFIERNSFDKMVSAYYFHTREEENPPSFEDWCIERVYKFPLDWDLYKTCENGKVFQYDNLWEVYEWLNTFDGIDITKEMVENTRLKGGFRKIADYRDLHTLRTIQITHSYFYREIQRFGYTFNKIA